MFSVGDYVVCGNKGACRVESITTLDISGADENEKYYILKSVYSAASTIYIPVNLAEETVRPILTLDEAKNLIMQIPQTPELEIQNEKNVELEYKGCVRSNNAVELVKLIKTIYSRKRMRIEAGRKETAVDAKYFKIGTDFLFGELALSLNIPKAEVEQYISKSGWGDRWPDSQ